jgi:hypothetical protein
MIELAEALCFADATTSRHGTECDGPADPPPSYEVRTAPDMREEAVISHAARLNARARA